MPQANDENTADSHFNLYQACFPLYTEGNSYQKRKEVLIVQYEKSCGAIVFRKYHGNTELLLIKHANGGHWSFPKGHVENGESEVDTARREIREETGIEVIIDPSFREIVSYSPKKDTLKEVVYFLAIAKTFNYTPQPEEISQIKWVEISRAHTVLSYDNDRQLVNKAKPFIKYSY